MIRRYDQEMFSYHSQLQQEEEEYSTVSIQNGIYSVHCYKCFFLISLNLTDDAIAKLYMT